MVKINNKKTRFIAVGVVNTGIDFILLNILTILGLPAIVSNTISTGCAMVFSFFTNKKFTFRSSSKKYLRELVLFLVFTLFGLWVLQNIVVYGLLAALPDDIPELWRLNGTKLVATAISLIWNFFTYDKFVFKKPADGRLNKKFFKNIWLKSISPLRSSAERINAFFSNKKNPLLRYITIYTTLFIVVCGLVFCWYFLSGKTFISQGDGWEQHYKALVYWAQYLRSIAGELIINHQLVIPEWGFSFGEGNDILQTLHYYVIGDPFTLLSVFIPTKFMWMYYGFMVILRMYLAGVIFSWLCFYTRKKTNNYAVLAGALTYVFCFWAIFNAARHPYFINPMIYFPLLILGVEKIIRNDKPYVLIVAVFLSAISNFYFLYMLALLTVVYAVVRLIIKYHNNIKSGIITFLNIAKYVVVGLLMGAVILVPICFTFMNDVRFSAGYDFHLFYPLSYYSGLPGLFVSSGAGAYWMCMGFTAPAIIAIFLLFLHKKQNTILKVFFLICGFIMLFPVFGQILNGLSYMNNRWCWAFALLCAYIFVVVWPDLMKVKLKDSKKLLGCLIVYSIVCLVLEYSRKVEVLISIVIGFIFLLVISLFRRVNVNSSFLRNKKQAVALLVVIIGISCISFFQNSTLTKDYASGMKEIEDVSYEHLMTNETNAIKQVAEKDGSDDFFRYSGSRLTHNSGALAGLSGTNYYWTIANSYMSDFRRDMELLESSTFRYKDYNSRTALNALSSVFYYAILDGDNTAAPYGFSYHTTISPYKIYKNDNPLPIAYAYNKAISYEEWSDLSPVKKQEAMLQAVVVDGCNDELQDSRKEYTSETLDYSIKNKNPNVTLKDGAFVVTKKDSSITLDFEGIENSETYLSIKGLSFDGASRHELYFGDDKFDPQDIFSKTQWDQLPFNEKKLIKKESLFWENPRSVDLRIESSAGIQKTLSYYTKSYNWYNDRHNFTVNLDYGKKALKSVTVTFPKTGIYSYDSIDVITQPMGNYKKQVTKLGEHSMENVDIGTDVITGDISLDENVILLFSIPYSDGWTAYVDGKEVSIYQANIKNMAIDLNAGDHEIQLIYETPYLRLGFTISIIGAGLFIIVIVLERKRQKH